MRSGGPPSVPGTFAASGSKSMSMAQISMATPAPPGPEERLDSWKEIAAYLKRGVRTVQRWERSGGLPVHRLAGQGSVFAYKPELDAWWAGRRQSTVTDTVPAGDSVAPSVHRRWPLWSVGAMALL